MCRKAATLVTLIVVVLMGFVVEGRVGAMAVRPFGCLQSQKAGRLFAGPLQRIVAQPRHDSLNTCHFRSRKTDLPEVVGLHPQRPVRLGVIVLVSDM